MRHSTQGRTKYELPGLNTRGLVSQDNWLPHIQRTHGVEHRVNMVHVIFIHRGERLVPILVFVNGDDSWDIGAYAIIFPVQRALPCARLRCCIWYPILFFMLIFFDLWFGSHKEWRLWKSYLLRATATAAYPQWFILWGRFAPFLKPCHGGPVPRSLMYRKPSFRTRTWL